ncbi:hypothetical protein D3C75_862590 [compost metagenome]
MNTLPLVRSSLNLGRIGKNLPSFTSWWVPWIPIARLLKVSFSSLALISFMASSLCLEYLGIAMYQLVPLVTLKDTLPSLPFRKGITETLASGKFLVRAVMVLGAFHQASL